MRYFARGIVSAIMLAIFFTTQSGLAYGQSNIRVQQEFEARQAQAGANGLEAEFGNAFLGAEALISTAGEGVPPTGGLTQIEFVRLNEHLPAKTKDLIERTAGWGQGPKPYFISGGRSLIMLLEKPLHLGNSSIKAIKLKGCGGEDRASGRILPPEPQMHRGRGSVAAKMSATNDGRLIFEDRYMQPVRGMMFDDAKREYDNARLLLSRRAVNQHKPSFYTLKPLGVGRYVNMRLEGKNLGFVIFGLEDVLQDKNRLDRINLDSDIMYCLGTEMRRFHDHGFIHSNPRINNFSWFRGRIFILDLADVLEISGFSLARQVAYRFRDMAYVLATLDREDFVQAFLKGYFSEYERNKTMISVITREVYPYNYQKIKEITEEAAERPLMEVNRELIRSLEEVTDAFMTMQAQAEAGSAGAAFVDFTNALWRKNESETDV